MRAGRRGPPRSRATPPPRRRAGSPAGRSWRRPRNCPPTISIPSAPPTHSDADAMTVSRTVTGSANRRRQTSAASARTSTLPAITRATYRMPWLSTSAFFGVIERPCSCPTSSTDSAPKTSARMAQARLSPPAACASASIAARRSAQSARSIDACQADGVPSVSRLKKRSAICTVPTGSDPGGLRRRIRSCVAATPIPATISATSSARSSRNCIRDSANVGPPVNGESGVGCSAASAWEGSAEQPCPSGGQRCRLRARMQGAWRTERDRTAAFQAPQPPAGPPGQRIRTA